jgi:recombination protein RecR
LEGIGPQDLKIQELLQRLSQTPSIKEVIFALDADLEGDTTVLFLSRQLANLGVKITRIAHGVPIGSDIDYIDDRTMGRALDNRIEL